MNPLLGVTGIYGVGKSYLCEKINKELDGSVKLTMDSIEEFVNENLKSDNRVNKSRNNEKVKNILSMFLEELMSRNNKCIILDGRFDKDWGGVKY